MTGTQAAVADATAAVFVGGRRAGSAVLVDHHHLVTARHVLLQYDRDAGCKILAEQVYVEFPSAAHGQARRAPAYRIDLGARGARVDVAILHLGDDSPSWLPPPVAVWSADRMPDRVAVFGYPLAEGPLNGIWRPFALAGPTTAGAMQLDWTSNAGTFPGHSGGPVVDAAGNTLAGILVEGSEEGRFDRFLPVTLIASVWPQLRRRWLMIGAHRTDARGHFTQRSRGQRSTARGGDMFRGRQAALSAVRRWLTDEESPGRPLVLTGQPGAGKSSVLARVALAIEADHGRPGLAFHARAATIGDFLAAVAELVGMEPPEETNQVINRLANMPEQPPTVLVVDALDEAASESDRRQMSVALSDIAVLPGLRVGVATRPLASGSSYRFVSGGLLSALGVTGNDSPGLVDLDTDTYFEAEDLRDFAAAMLAQDGMDHPGPRRGAWQSYRAERSICNRLADVIAKRAGRNFLIAAMSSAALSTAREVIDPATIGFNPAVIPASVGDALDKYFDQLHQSRRERQRGLLSALAYGRGEGLDDVRWLAFAHALDYEANAADLEMLRRSAASDYLLETRQVGSGGRHLTRLFHQALTDELLAYRDHAYDEGSLLDVLLDEATRTEWTADYPQQYVAAHAAAAGRLDELLDNHDYLLAADPGRLVSELDVAHSAGGRVTATVYRQAAHLLQNVDRGSRASELELYSHYLGHHSLAARIGGAAPDRPWRTRWSQGRTVTDHQALNGHDGSVNAVTAGVLPDGTAVIVSGGDDATLRMWRMSDGTPLGAPLAGHDGAIRAVAFGALRDGTPVFISGGDDHTVRVWLASGHPAGAPLTGHQGAVEALAVGTLADGTPVVISGSTDHTVRVWKLGDGTRVGEPLTGDDGRVWALAVSELPDGTPVVVSGWDTGTVRVSRLADGTPTGKSFTGHNSPVNAIAAGALPDGTPVIISANLDLEDTALVRWRLSDGSTLGEPLIGHEGPVTAMAVGVLPDRTPVIVSGSLDHTVRVWRLTDGSILGEPLTGHDRQVTSVAPGILSDGTLVVISGSSDGSVRVWRLTEGVTLGQPLTGHSGEVSAIAISTMPDSSAVIISGAHDHTVRVWHLADGAPIGEPLKGHDGAVSAVAAGLLSDGTPVIISGGNDQTVRVWRLVDGLAADF